MCGGVGGVYSHRQTMGKKGTIDICEGKCNTIFNYRDGLLLLNKQIQVERCMALLRIRHF